MQKEILKNEVYLFVGPLEFKILKGKLEAVGCILQHKTHIQLLHTIPAGKSIPFECHKDSIIQIQSGDINNIKPLEKSTIPVQWDKLVARIKDKNLKRIIVLGEMDTGKSFFITYLANKLIQLKRKVGVIDSDLGQSDVGPPGTIAFTVLKEPILLLSDAAITGMEFVGSHSPGLHMVPTLVQFSKIMNQCLKMCDIMLVNTSGWVLGDGGRLLSRSKIDILDPDIIVLMQKEDECEHLVKTVFSKDMLIRLRASRKVLDTSKGDREKLRNLSSQKYFQNSKEMTLPLDKIETDKCFFKTGKSINDIASFTDKNILFAEKYPVFEG
ncbi:MAG: hypothetical protein KKH98_12745, partial [Spirochaetes bacterium]|nr:hypothetical protein [Spirochaetota bacterium]